MLPGHLQITCGEREKEREPKSAALRGQWSSGVGGGLHEMSREELIGWGRGGCRVKTDTDVYTYT